MLARFRLLFANEFRLELRDGIVFIILIMIPVLLTLFIRDAMKAALAVDPATRNASGADQAIPGMAVMFLFYLANFEGISFFRDHTWGTWDRLRASRAGMREVVLAKVGVLFVIGVLQLAILFPIGRFALGLHIRGS